MSEYDDSHWRADKRMNIGTIASVISVGLILGLAGIRAAYTIETQINQQSSAFAAALGTLASRVSVNEIKVNSLLSDPAAARIANKLDALSDKLEQFINMKTKVDITQDSRIDRLFDKYPQNQSRPR